MGKSEVKLQLKNLCCANCADKIERRVSEISEVKECTLNFAFSTISIVLNNESQKNQVIDKVKDIVKSVEPDVIVEENGLKINNDKLNSKNIHATLKCPDDCNCSVKYKYDKQEDNKTLLKIKKNLPLLLGAIVYVIGIIIGDDKFISTFIFGAAYILVGYKVLYSAFRRIFKGELFDENFLMAVATIGAFAIRKYSEAVAVMIFYEIGEIFQDYAVQKSRKSIADLMDIRPDYANKIVDGVAKKVHPKQVKIGDTIEVRPGEKIPLDGIVIEGNSSLNTSALTGESIPKSVSVDDEVLSGSININGLINVRVTKTFGESTVSKILELVQNASSKKAQSEKFITKFARYYTPIVVALAAALAVIPPLVTGDEFSGWVYRALIFLVVSCPCALVISIPLGLFAGIGGASKKGILIKGGNYLEALSKVDTVVFDKTGTLTKGTFKVVDISNIGISKEELIRTAALAESYSSHPIGQSIIKAYGGEIDKSLVKDYQEIAGNGIKATIEGKTVIVGNYKIMKQNNLKCLYADEAYTVVHVSIDSANRGYIVISDEVKEDSKEAINNLRKLGVKNIVMLTGDNNKVADRIAKELSINEVYSELLPTDKVEKLEELLKRKTSVGNLIFVGDGINDAPVIARADIGVSMGALGSDAAIEASDVVLMRDEPSLLPKVIEIAKKTNGILIQNIIFALVVKGGVLILSALGLVHMWAGVFADVGVTLIAVINSMRALSNK